MMRRARTAQLYIYFILILPFIPAIARSQQNDPWFSESGGFGYRIDSGADIGLWWCEGAYKVMTDSPLPHLRDDTIRLWSARNEYEPFMIVINPAAEIRNVNVNIGELVGKEGSVAAENIDIRMVEYVYVSKPSDSYGFKGWWPDPLPYAGNNFTLPEAKNSTLWFTVYIPHNSSPGEYLGNVVLTLGNKQVEIPVSLEVWDFTLPDTPSLRSGFGLSVDKIIDYHNLSDSTDIATTFDLYMENFRRYRIAPYYPQALAPPVDIISGLEWEGGYFDAENPHSGRYSLRIEDDDATAVAAARYRKMIKVESGVDYRIDWYARTGEDGQQFCLLVEGYDSAGSYIVFENRMEQFTGTTKWKKYTYRPGKPGEGVSMVKLTLFPVFRSVQGEFTGTAWFDNITLTAGSNSTNLLKQGDFETDISNIGVTVDFTDFDRAAERYLDQFGFNSFRIDINGLGSGTYYSRKEGYYAGFREGTNEYNLLMSSYLSQTENHLREKGWLDKAYVYWFDEPGRPDYPFVREGMQRIKDWAPGLPTLLTENEPGPEIMDVTDITCTLWNRVDISKARTVIHNGNEYWSYLCTAPKYPWISQFIDHDAINLRMWSWGTWAYGLNGILIWSTNYWTSRSASPPGYLQNPWSEPASFVQGYGWPLGKQTVWGNGDGRLFYPPNRDPNKNRESFVEGPVPSIRLEFLRQGIEDYEYFVQLKNLVEQYPDQESELVKEARELFSIPASVFSDGKTYTKDPLDIYRYRRKLAEAILNL